MKPLVCIVGINGNMARRYKAICLWLGLPVTGYDVGASHRLKEQAIGDATHIIVATPTDTHYDVLSEIKLLNIETSSKSILCEKPVSKLRSQVKNLLEWFPNFFMVNNYVYMDRSPKENSDNTWYSYFKTGDDGLLWDCIQVIHLAKGVFELETLSPTWLCQINGQIIKRVSVDSSYVEMIKDFTGPQERLWGKGDILAATNSVIYHERYQDNPYRYSGEKH